MSAVIDLLAGFGVALSGQNLLYCFIGSVLGTLVGVLPGIGPTSAIAILLPITSSLSPMPAIIMLAGIYYGAMYGGSTTSILLNMPGEVASVPTCLDGYEMAKQGRAGPALAIAAISSFFAGTISLLGLTFFAPTLADAALAFGPPEYFALMLFALTMVINLSGKDIVKGFISALFGFLVSAIGLDAVSGSARFTFGSIELMGGINFISVIIGLFAVAEILSSLEESITAVFPGKIKGLLPTLKDLKTSLGAMIRSTFIGFFLGLLPGLSTGITAFMAYDVEKRVSKHPERFGKGAIEGVAAPEGANNSATSGAFIPLLSLGIPPGPALAVLLGAFMIYGLQPGPLLFEHHSGFAWGLIASMYIGNLMLLVLNLPLVGIWVKVCKIPYAILSPLVLIFSFIGAFSVRDSMFDVWMAVLFGGIGYLMKKMNYPSAPMVLAIVLASRLEGSLRESLNMSMGNPAILFNRLISLGLIMLALLFTVLSFWARKKHVRIMEEAVEDRQ
jgi:putative tricarboxylic transport membrane protein